jgi:tetratricopeptide (TPR) repeat protein
MITYAFNRFLLPLKIIGYFCISISSLASTVTAQISSEKHFSRVVNDNALSKTVLQLPVRKFERRGKVGPVVTLQSMVHIADRSFFEQQQKFAESHDVVLFERTNLPGAGRQKYTLQNSDSAESRVALTKIRLITLGFLGKELKNREGKLPRSFSELKEKSFKLRSRDMLAKDGWDNDFQFRINPNEQLEILSLGRANRLADCYDQIGLRYQMLEQWEKAFECLGKVEEIKRSLVNRYPKDVAAKSSLTWTLARLGEIYLEMGQYEKALKFFREGRDMVKLVVDADSKLTELRLKDLEYFDRQIQNAKPKE